MLANTTERMPAPDDPWPVLTQLIATCSLLRITIQRLRAGLRDDIRASDMGVAAAHLDSAQRVLHYARDGRPS
jgi:hypothetical protein